MNIQKLMQEAQKMQADLNKTQKELSKTEYEGSSSLVKVIVNGETSHYRLVVGTTREAIDEYLKLKDFDGK